MVQIRSADVEVAGVDFGFFGGRAILVRPSGLRPYIHDCTFHDSRDGGGDRNAHEAVSPGLRQPDLGRVDAGQGREQQAVEPRRRARKRSA
jgi:hypothetical protein